MITQDEPKKLRVALYMRVSTEEQSVKNWGFGIPSQKEVLLQYLKSREDLLELAWEEHIYIDEDVSWVSEPTERPAMSKMINDFKYRKSFDMILVYRLDRFARKLIILLQFIQSLTEYDVKFASARESIDTSTPFWKAMIGILWVFAELEKDLIEERTQGWIEQAKKAWKRFKDIYGYRRNELWEFEIVPEQAKVIQTIFRLFWDDWLTVTEIRKYLKNNQILRPWIAMSKKKIDKNVWKWIYDWDDKSIRKYLQEDTYIGKYFYEKSSHKVMKSKDQWRDALNEHDAIVEQELFDRVQEMYHRKKWNYVTTDESMLTWLITCDCCKEWRKSWRINRVKSQDNNTLVYKCSWKHKPVDWIWCHMTPIPRDQLDNLVLEEVKNIVCYPEIITMYLNNQDNTDNHILKLRNRKDKLENDLIKLKQKFERIRELFIAGDYEQKEFNKQKDEIKKEEIAKTKELYDINYELSNTIDTCIHIEAFAQLYEIIKSNSNNIFEDKKLARWLLKILIDEVTIYWRDKNESDFITGRPKSNQQIPYKIKIKFKLPSEFLNYLMKWIEQQVNILNLPWGNENVVITNPSIENKQFPNTVVHNSLLSYLLKECSPQIGKFISIK